MFVSTHHHSGVCVLVLAGAIMLTDFERFFLDALSMVLVLTAIALLLFVRYRLH